MLAFRQFFDAVGRCTQQNFYTTSLFLMAMSLTACSSTHPIKIPAPVIDHSLQKSGTKDSPDEATVKAATSPVVESTIKPGYYTVKSGDTLIHISLDNGQNWKDLVRWNNLDNPNRIEVGQVLRVLPPESNVSSEGVVVRPVGPQNNPTPAAPPPSVGSSSTASNPTTSATTTSTHAGSSSSGAVSATPTGAAGSGVGALATTATTATTAATAATLATPTPRATPSPSVVSGENSSDTPSFIWPSSGKVIVNFDEAKNKGIDIGGKLGEPVLAAADGKVVYSGSGLRGYGNLIIIKHNNTYLTAYAHNQTLIAKEDQQVKQGQKIAELGNGDSDQPLVHFEIRKLGKPVDPLKWLPQR